MKRFLDQAVENLFPGYFSLVMATGIISVASYHLEMRMIARALLVINIAAYVVLWSLTLLRLTRFFPRALSDLASHGRGPGFFTLIAGTCVLGAQLVIVAGSFTVAKFLWLCGLTLWLLLMYAFFTAVIVREEKPALETGVNGSWLLAVVAIRLGVGNIARAAFQRWARIAALLHARHAYDRLCALSEPYHAYFLPTDLR
jgi:tellurite resistance protein TehA-like permease